MHGLTLFFSVFAMIFVAELPDKTALAALVLATRHRPLPVLLGSASALTIQSAVAVGAGELVSLLPKRPVHIFAGLLFLLFAVLMWRRKEEAEEKKEEGPDASARTTFRRSLWTTFTVVFIAEWGDLTQLATATIAAENRAPFVVFAGSTAALWSVTTIAVLIGNRAGKLLDPHLTQKVAAVLFALVGIALLAGLI